VLLVNLLPELFAAQRIAFFGRNVHILYMVEMTLDCMLLLCLLTSERPKNRGLALQYCNEPLFSQGHRCGKNT
jgi:hypothetical protein